MHLIKKMKSMFAYGCFFSTEMVKHRQSVYIFAKIMKTIQKMFSEISEISCKRFGSASAQHNLGNLQKIIGNAVNATTPLTEDLNSVHIAEQRWMVSNGRIKQILLVEAEGRFLHFKENQKTSENGWR